MPVLTVRATAEIDMPRSLLCESSEVAIAGYYNAEIGRPATASRQSTALERQPTPSQWRVDAVASTDLVRVTRYSGSTKQLESPEIWTGEGDPMGFGWLLLKAKRPPGQSPKTITVTHATLHFIYSTHHVNPFYNRANVWVGQCRSTP
jgi:hypothetical protein